MSTQHIDDGGRHVEQLDQRVRDLSTAFDDLGTSDDFKELLRIIHFPGWTTLPDVFFMNVLIDSAERAVDDARRIRQALLEGARAIGEASAAGLESLSVVAQRWAEGRVRLRRGRLRGGRR
jgi:hypothetical protein